MAFETVEPVHSVIVDTEKRFLYWILSDGKGIRCGVGDGTQGRTWKGRAVIHYKRKWPRWIPTEGILARSPKMKIYGVESGGCHLAFVTPWTTALCTYSKIEKIRLSYPPKSSVGIDWQECVSGLRPHVDTRFVQFV